VIVEPVPLWGVRVPTGESAALPMIVHCGVYESLVTVAVKVWVPFTGIAATWGEMKMAALG